MIRLYLVVVLLLAGCRHRSGLPFDGSAFRLVGQGGGGLMLPPPVVSQSGQKELLFSIPVKAGVVKGAECRVANEFFELKVEGGRAELRMRQMENVEELLAAPDLLVQKRCLADASVQLLRETIPMRPELGLYGAYGYRAGGEGLDLRAGVRLKIVRAHFDRLAAERKSALDGYVGLTTVSFDSFEDERGRVGFRYQGVDAKPDSVRAIGEDLAFGKGARVLPVYRLLMLTHYLKSGTKRAALVLGTSSVAEMRGLEKRLRENPGESCAALVARSKGVCFSFEGEVTVSPEVLVRVNGEVKALAWGTSLRMFAGQAKTVTLRRFWGKKLRSVEVEGDATALLNTALVGGDEVEYR